MALTQQELRFLLWGVNVENPMLARICRDLAVQMSRNQPQQAQKKRKPNTEQMDKKHDLIEPEAAKVMETFFNSLSQEDRQQTETFLREELERRGVIDNASSDLQSSASAVQ